MASITLIMPALPAAAAPEPEAIDSQNVELYAFENFFALDSDYVEFAEYGGCPRGTFRVRRHTRTKKKLLKAALASGIGAAIGGGIGGGRGALFGAGIGAGGYFTYKYIKDRRGRCVRVRA